MSPAITKLTINLDSALLAHLQRDAEENERPISAQARYVLRQHYHAREGSFDQETKRKARPSP